MRCKIVRFQKLMWRNMMRLIKSQKTSVLHYSIDRYRLYRYRFGFLHLLTNSQHYQLLARRFQCTYLLGKLSFQPKGIKEILMITRY